MAAYVLDALPEDELRAFEAHAAGCARCTAELAELRPAAAALGHAVEADPSPGLRERVLAAVDAEPARAPGAVPEAGTADAGAGTGAGPWAAARTPGTGSPTGTGTPNEPGTSAGQGTPTGAGTPAAVPTDAGAAAAAAATAAGAGTTPGAGTAPGPGTAPGDGTAAGAPGAEVAGVSGVPGVGEVFGGRPVRRRVAVALAAVAAAALAAGGVAAVWQHGQTQDARAALQRADAQAAAVADVLAAPDVQLGTRPVAGQGRGTVAVARSENAAAFFASDLPALPAGKAYAMWFSDDGAYRPAGLLGGSGDQQLRLRGPVARATAVCITVEADTGAARPTPPVVGWVGVPAEPPEDTPSPPADDADDEGPYDGS
ncbi:anti-sigma factor domain-containing protein [Streptomyces sp. NPDC086023]|uniref:anti-sigma factor n=1 Tax=Streptomyces sp. NPDC086023 TaxID=3365746 RepID=UPI0037D17F40